ncbi:MAG: AAA domain-containing protein [Phycisphaerae bacterium]|nr:AAA domain-containing protein [Phycisphaerae bacterium]
MGNENAKRLLEPEQLNRAAALAKTILEQMDRILLGQNELHQMVLIGLLSRGHILLEGVPGVGKTAMIKGLGQLMNLTFNRVQFTPDIMPGDILGSHILQEDERGKREMVFEPGPIFSHILLADEINRASPKTQSAMLEAMQEGHVTLMGQTRPLPRPFFVLASQNPIELEGTYPLPEAQLDRFLFKLNVACAPVEVMDAIITSRRRGEPPVPEKTVGPAELEGLFEVMEHIFLPRPVSRYIARLVSATHPDSAEAIEPVRQYVSYGASPRAAIAIAEAARGKALISGRPTVGFEDVRAVAPAVLNHRIILNYKARFDTIQSSVLIEQLLTGMDETGMTLPADITLKERANV